MLVQMDNLRPTKANDRRCYVLTDLSSMCVFAPELKCYEVLLWIVGAASDDRAACVRLQTANAKRFSDGDLLQIDWQSSAVVATIAADVAADGGDALPLTQTV